MNPNNVPGPKYHQRASGIVVPDNADIRCLPDNATPDEPFFSFDDHEFPLFVTLATPQGPAKIPAKSQLVLFEMAFRARRNDVAAMTTLMTFNVKIADRHGKSYWPWPVPEKVRCLKCDCVQPRSGLRVLPQLNGSELLCCIGCGQELASKAQGNVDVEWPSEFGAGWRGEVVE